MYIEKKISEQERSEIDQKEKERKFKKKIEEEIRASLIKEIEIENGKNDARKEKKNDLGNNREL